jgi:PQQ-like domain
MARWSPAGVQRFSPARLHRPSVARLRPPSAAWLRRPPPSWIRRGLLAVVLIGAAVIPGYASTTGSRPCTGPRCGPSGTIRWVRPLNGSWIADGGVIGTVPALGQAYVSPGPQVAAIGYGTNVYGFDVRTGRRLWATALAGFPAGASIVSVRSWAGEVTAGVTFTYTSTGGTARDEVVLSDASGQEIHAFPAAGYGGAVAAGGGRTVIIGKTAVTSYDNASGRVVWSRATGRVAQAWRADGRYLYVTISAGGYLGSAPVTALRRIDLKTGSERTIRPPGGSFDGTLSGAFDGVVLFSNADGVTAYSETTGQLRWRRRGVVAESDDPVRPALYVTSGTGLTGLNPLTGVRLPGAAIPDSSGVYGVRNGVALGLDQGAAGDAWGYNIGARHVIWTTPSLPWPHYFVDPSGIGGSAGPYNPTILLAACARLGAAAKPGGAASCLKPELVAINR